MSEAIAQCERALVEQGRELGLRAQHGDAPEVVEQLRALVRVGAVGQRAQGVGPGRAHATDAELGPRELTERGAVVGRDGQQLVVLGGAGGQLAAAGEHARFVEQGLDPPARGLQLSWALSRQGALAGGRARARLLVVCGLDRGHLRALGTRRGGGGGLLSRRVFAAHQQQEAGEQ